MNSDARRKRVLVTGASGRVGRHAVDALVVDLDVTVLDLAPSGQDVPLIFLYYERGNPRAVVSPDVYVVAGALAGLSDTQYQ